MRLTLKFMLKSLVVVLLMLFLLPLLLHKLDSQEEAARRHKQALKRTVKKDLELQEKRLQWQRPADSLHNDNAAAAAGHNDLGHDQLQDQVAPPGLVEMKQEGDDEQNLPEKKYGPKAELKSGILGNYEPRNLQPKDTPGEFGEPVYTSMSEKTAADRSVREFGFNMVASDKISMDRNIPDTRLDECKYWHYPEELPTASVIIVFHNEGWSTLMRTVHSVINTSPAHLLAEVVMVDDFSDKEHLKSRLEKYIEQFKGKVKLYRNTERLGLIGTRTLGAQYATGDVIVFLDAHCECNRNWLPPLLARIAYDRTIMAVPIIDGIDWNSFRYSPVYQNHDHFRGIFEWGFLYKESKVPHEVLAKRQHNSEPYWSPTHAGGLFAMDRNYFFELGGYDPGLQIWGGENFELSFKIWQCGGSIEWVPCSRVGHVYRNAMPYSFGKISPKIPVILINYMRVVEVWLDDEYKEYFYSREPTIRGYPIGDIHQQLEFKHTHKCKSFKWFLDNVATEVVQKFPFPPLNKAWGEVKEKNGPRCWDTIGQHVGGGPISMSGCHHLGGNQIKNLNSGSQCWDLLSPILYHKVGLGSCHHRGGHQLFRLNMEGQLGVGERCIDATSAGLQLQYCPVQPTGPWQWDQDTGLIRHSKRKQCVEAVSNSEIKLQTCDVNNSKQQWTVNEVRTW